VGKVGDATEPAAKGQPRNEIRGPVAAAVATPAAQGAKIAARGGVGNATGKFVDANGNKNSLDTEYKVDKKSQNDIGTTAAKAIPAMASSRFGSPGFSPAEAGTAVSSLRSAVVSTETAGSGPGESAATAARRAVETVAQIAEAQAGRGESTDVVSFGLKLGDDSLTVRVEMRQGEVRTQFSTDSADLRLAIAGEWPGLSEGSAERTYHFSAPEFAAADGPASDAGADTGGADRQPALPFDSAPGGSSTANSPETDPEPDAVAATARMHATARYLQTVA